MRHPIIGECEQPAFAAGEARLDEFIEMRKVVPYHRAEPRQVCGFVEARPDEKRLNDETASLLASIKRKAVARLRE